MTSDFMVLSCSLTSTKFLKVFKIESNFNVTEILQDVDIKAFSSKLVKISDDITTLFYLYEHDVPE